MLYPQDQLTRRSTELRGDMSTIQTQLFSTRKELDRVKRDKAKSDESLADTEKQLHQLRASFSEQNDTLSQLKEHCNQLETKFKVRNNICHNNSPVGFIIAEPPRVYRSLRVCAASSKKTTPSVCRTCLICHHTNRVWNLSCRV